VFLLFKIPAMADQRKKKKEKKKKKIPPEYFLSFISPIHSSRRWCPARGGEKKGKEGKKSLPRLPPLILVWAAGALTRIEGKGGGKRNKRSGLPGLF